MENKQKEKLKELITANKELVFQNERKEKRAEELRRELVLAIEKFAFENEEKEKRAAELKIVNKELALQIKEKEKRAVEFAISQDKLMKSDRLFQLMISSINDYAIIMLDTKGNIATWNSGAQRIKGYAEDEIIGKSMDVFYTRQAINNKEPQKNLQAALQQGRFEKEDWRVRKDKSLFYANVIITSLFDYEGKHYGYAKVTRDITEQKKKGRGIKKNT